MTEEYEKGANHIIESVHCFLLDKASEGNQPSTLFVQVYKCTRENKNRHFIRFLECLVKWGLFVNVEVGFLSIGNTHEEQCFSRTSDRLRYNNSITLEDLQNEFWQSYNGKTRVSHMKRVAIWSGICENERCLSRKPRFSHFLYFNSTEL